MARIHTFKTLSTVLIFIASNLVLITARSIAPRQTSNFVGYLVSTFSDPVPAVQFHISNGNDPGSFTFANGGKPVLTSTVGTKGVRDIFLTTNGDRSKWYIIATDLDVNAPGFSWDQATRTGSRSIVVWSSDNLVDWSEPRLAEIETPTAGMLWAPSAVWDPAQSLFHVFWSSRAYSPSDPSHTSAPLTPDVIRHATTTDFVTFSSPDDYTLPSSTTPLIDQEFLFPDPSDQSHVVRYLKNESVNLVYAQVSRQGLFAPESEWARVPGYVSETPPTEGPLVFKDNIDPGLYHIWLDIYSVPEYAPFESRAVEQAGSWTRSEYPAFPKGLRHGCVTPLLQGEYDALRERFAA